MSRPTRHFVRRASRVALLLAFAMPCVLWACDGVLLAVLGGAKIDYRVAHWADQADRATQQAESLAEATTPSQVAERELLFAQAQLLRLLSKVRKESLHNRDFETPLGRAGAMEKAEADARTILPRNPAYRSLSVPDSERLAQELLGHPSARDPMKSFLERMLPEIAALRMQSHPAVIWYLRQAENFVQSPPEK